MAVGLPEGPSYPGHSPPFFAMLPPERPQKGSMVHPRALTNVARVFYFRVSDRKVYLTVGFSQIFTMQEK